MKKPKKTSPLVLHRSKIDIRQGNAAPINSDSFAFRILMRPKRSGRFRTRFCQPFSTIPKSRGLRHVVSATLPMKLGGNQALFACKYSTGLTSSSPYAAFLRFSTAPAACPQDSLRFSTSRQRKYWAFPPSSLCSKIAAAKVSSTLYSLSGARQTAMVSSGGKSSSLAMTSTAAAMLAALGLAVSERS